MKPVIEEMARPATSMATFDGEGQLLFCSGDFEDLIRSDQSLATKDQLLSAYLNQVSHADQLKFDAGDLEVTQLIKRWSQPNSPPIQVMTQGEDWKLLSTSGSIGGSVSFIATDINDQRQQLNHGRRVLADAIEALSEGFALYDEDGDLVMCNSEYRAMNSGVADLLEPGLNWEILMRESARRGIYADAIGREAEWVNDQLSNGGEFIQAFELKHTDGKVFHVSVHPTKLGGFVVTRTDVTSVKEAEALKGEADELVNKVLEACPASILMSRIDDGGIIYRSPAAREMFGMSKSTKDHFADSSSHADFLTDLLPFGATDDFRVTCMAEDGSSFPASVSARLIEYRGDEVIVSSTVDLSDLVEAQAEILRAAERLTDAVQSLDEGFALFDKDQRLVTCNELYLKSNHAFSEIITPGVHYDEILTRSPVRPEDPNLLEYYDTVRQRQEGVPARGRWEIKEEDGVWYSTSNSPTSEGGFVITRLDVTRQKQMEEEQRAADEILRRVLEACPVPIVMSRVSDGKLLFKSPETTALLGNIEFFFEAYLDFEALEKYRQKLIKFKHLKNHRFRMQKAGGELFWASVSCRMIDFKGEQVIVSNIRDLTDELALEQELSTQRDILFQSEKMSALGELLAGVAHELNNPLSIIVGHSLMLQEELTGTESSRRVTTISTAAQRCAKIIKTFLAMARQKPADMQEVDMNLVVETAVDVTNYSVTQGKVRITVNLQEALPVVLADIDQVTQVIVNLIINAEQALSVNGGGGTISISSGYDAKRKDVFVMVADDGPGIPEKLRARIFEPFFTTKEVGQGTGIGLAICHRIMESHGGRIFVDSVIGEGTNFIVRLPVNSAKSTDVENPEITEKTVLNQRVLVVDDEQDVAELLKEMLERDGFEVHAAFNGIDALERLRSEEYALVLSDLNMPGLDGKGLFEATKNELPDVVRKIGFITGDTLSKEAERFLEHSGRPYLEKPVSPIELRKLISSMLEVETNEHR